MTNLKTILIILLIPVLGIGQTYHKTLEEGKIWYVSAAVGMGFYANANYTVSCDTTINSMSYFYLYKMNPSVLQGFLREDTIAQKVYFLPVDSTDEYLILDYMLAPGDTFVNYTNTAFTGGNYFTYEPKEWVVDYVDTVYIAQSPHKRINFLYLPQPEGLIFTEGRGNQYVGIAIPFSNHGSVSVYYNSNITCSVILPVTSIAEEANLRITPNPFDNTVLIEVDEKYFAEAGALEGAIYDLAGKQIMVIRVEKQNELNLDYLSRGIYVLKLNGFQSIKLVKN